MGPHLGGVEIRILDSVGDDPVPYLDLEFKEGFVVVFDGYVEANALEEWDSIEKEAELVKPDSGQGELGIDSFSRDVNPAQYFQRIESRVEAIPESGRVLYSMVFIEREGDTLLARSIDPFGPLLGARAIIGR
jgi:hypothetical protein